MRYKVKEIITDNGKVVSEAVYEYANEIDMENGITSLRIQFNEKRLATTIEGNGIGYLNVKQEFIIL